MAHSFYYIPIHVWVGLTEFSGQHIDGFANDFYMFYKTVKKNGIVSNFLKFVASFAVQQNIDGIQHVFQSAYVLNPVSHISKSCRD